MKKAIHSKCNFTSKASVREVEMSQNIFEFMSLSIIGMFLNFCEIVFPHVLKIDIKIILWGVLLKMR